MSAKFDAIDREAARSEAQRIAGRIESLYTAVRNDASARRRVNKGIEAVETILDLLERDVTEGKG